MTVQRATYRHDGDRYLGLNSDTKPTEGVKVNALFEETDTGAIFKFSGVKWNWYSTAKALDHNRMMLGLGKSYKTGDRLAVPSGDHAVYRFNPGAVGYHHSESRIVKVAGGTVKFEIYTGSDIADLPTKIKDLRRHNQKGLLPADENSELIYSYHGIVDDAALATIIGAGEEADTDYFFAVPGQGRFGGTPEASALPSGRHYLPNTDYIIVITADDGDPIDYFYTYFWHEG